MAKTERDIQLTPAFFQSGDIIDGFHRLQEEAPVYLQQDEPERVWALTKYDDVVFVSKNPALFCSGQGTILNTPVEGSMLSMDDPRHKQLRGLVEKGFTARLVRDFEPHTREVTRKILDEIGDANEIDFVDQLSAPLPLRVIVEMLGAPPEDALYLRDLGDIMIGHDDPDFTGGDQEKAAKAQIDMFEYFRKMADDHRRTPRDDLINTLMHAELDGEGFEEMDFLIFCMLLVIAGNETTRNLISGGATLLFNNPDQQQRLVDDPSLSISATEEMLRMISSVMHFTRTATEDTEIRFQAIAKGEKVCLWYVAANRDPDVFPEPDRFDISRAPNTHVAFGGGGPHFCLGASLARQEIRVMFEELLSRYPKMALNGEVERLRSNFIRGIKSLPVKLRP